MVDVSSWKKGHYASNVPLPRSRTHMDKGQKQSDLIIIFFIRKRGLSHMVHHCALYSVKADIQHIMVVVKTTLFRFFVVYRFSVLLFRPRKTIFWNSITFSDPGVLLQYLSKKSKHCCVIC